MNILFLFITYPENPLDSSLTKDLSDEFGRRGNGVYIATIREKRHNLETSVKCERGVNVLRVKTGNMFGKIGKLEKTNFNDDST